MRTKNNTTTIYTLLFLCCMLFSCIEHPEYDVVPRIEFLEAIPYYSYDQLGNKQKNIALSFMLYDGDGDIGKGSRNDTIPDFFSSFYVFKDNDFQALSNFITYNSNYTLPQLRDKNYSGFLKAEVTLQLGFSAGTFPYDTCFVSFYVQDRAGNSSNTDTSSVIIF